MRITIISYSALAFATLAIGNVSGSDETNSPNGINSAGLTLPNGVALTGDGISIGQVEFARPMDPDLNDTSFNEFIDPEMVFFKSANATMDQQLDVHPLHVAGIMISSDIRTGDQILPVPDPLPGMATGVAPMAKLYASASTRFSDLAQDHMVAANHVATRDNDEVRAINLSFGHMPGGLRDGNSQFTLFVDWSASQHDTLYVSAFGESSIPVMAFSPTDNFNGITVAASDKDTNGVYSQVAGFNNYAFDAEGTRTSVDLIAPGADFVLASIDGRRFLAGGTSVANGTSWAAPHVTGTVALLQEYGDDRITAHAANPANAPNWGGVDGGIPSPRRHEVMKAVLMNSADKLIDDGTVLHPTTGQPIPAGRLLGMERTVIKQDFSSTWFNSAAYLDEDEFGTFLDTDTPLDNEMGTGHLNAKRALQQFAPGEHDFNGTFSTPIVGDVPLIGWDYGSISGTSLPINKYLLDEPLVAGNFISITLAWDRVTELITDDGVYNAMDGFESFTELDEVLANLDIFLVEAGATDIGEFDVAISNSEVSPVEHIFAEIPTDGQYEIWVVRDTPSGASQNYGLAWWYGLAPDIEPPDVTGDFDSDGDVDGADFLVWQRNPTMFSLADWQAGYGNPLSAATAVPEPGSCLLLLMGIVVGLRGRWQDCATRRGFNASE